MTSPVTRTTARLALLALLALASSAAAETTFVVNNAGDVLGSGVGSGTCETSPGNSTCTLRRAIAEASALMPAGSTMAMPEVTILIDVPLVTVAPLASPLAFTGRGILNVIGGGPAVTTIEASGINLFDLSGSTDKTVRLAGVTVLHAATAIDGRGRLLLEDATLANSGTALRWTAGLVTITGSIIRDNDGTTGFGSAVVLTAPSTPNATHRVRRTTFRGNAGLRGGALELAAGDLDLDVVTFSHNSGQRGGALFVDATASLHASRTTFALNTAADSGGALYMNGRDNATVNGGKAWLAHVTLSGNRADGNQDGTGSGGGIAVTSGTTGTFADVRLTHTLNMGNDKMIFTTFWLASPSECEGPLTLTGPNLFGLVDCSVSGTSPIVGDALFLPLQNNGGVTQTKVPGIGSPAIDAGNAGPCLDAYGAVLTRDQRGHVAPAAATVCDIGAVEKDTVAAVAAKPYDLDGDNRSDLVWRHRATGDNALWRMNGGTLLQGLFLTAVPDTNFTILGSDDFDGDGYADLLWRHGSGINAVWLMRGSTILEGIVLPGLADTPAVQWRMAGTGDLDGDTRADILWEKLTWDQTSGTFIHSGQTTAWLMDGGAIKGVRMLPALPNWTVAGVGDVNRDGTSDLLWRGVDNGGTAVWIIANAAVASTNALPTVSEYGWVVAGFADVDGDKRADIVWRNTTDIGHTALWLMDGPSIVGGGYLPNVNPWVWRLVHVQDLDGDNRADLVWRATNGLNAWWGMNGMTIVNAGLLTTVTDTRWEIK